MMKNLIVGIVVQFHKGFNRIILIFSGPKKNGAMASEVLPCLPHDSAS